MKVTISIDDTNPMIVAAFGADSINTIADSMGYMDDVYKDASELPAMVDSGKVDLIGNPIMEYPEGTVLTKPNPQTRAQFVGATILKNRIVPALIERFAQIRRDAANKEIEAEIEEAKTIVTQAAEVIVE